MNLTLIAAVNSYIVPAVADFFQTNQNYGLYNYGLYIFNVSSIISSIPDIINFIYIMFLMGNVLYSTLVNHNN